MPTKKRATHKQAAARKKFAAKVKKAKAIHKKSPGKKWATCMKEA